MWLSNDLIREISMNMFKRDNGQNEAGLEMLQNPPRTQGPYFRKNILYVWFLMEVLFESCHESHI